MNDAKHFQWLIICIFVLFFALAGVHFYRGYVASKTLRSEVEVTIPEGSTIYDIDRILSGAGVISQGVLINSTSSLALEGTLFPDTYYFFPSSTVGDVVQKMEDDFAVKAEPLLVSAGQNASSDLILASIVQKEVASLTDQAIVAGILEKRLAMGIPLDVDASICYIKQQEYPTSTGACSLDAADFKIDSPYNTYLYRGLPPGPIGNPGAQAIEATLNPVSSTYLYYLSDPKTGETIYAATLGQQEANQKKYLQD
jgi:UPF0755 protein